MYYHAIPHNKYVTIQGQYDKVYRGPTDAVFIIVIDLDRGECHLQEFNVQVTVARE